MPCRAAKDLECVFPFYLHSAAVSDSHLSCHAMPIPCSDHAVFLKATAQHGRLSTAVLCCGLEENGMVGAWHGHGVASVNQTRPHCVNQRGKTHYKLLAARQGNGMGTACYVWIGLKPWVCSTSLAGIAGSNPFVGMTFCILWVFCVVC